MIKKIFSWMITAIAVAILFWACRLSIESRDALKWPHTKGHVISSLLTIKHLPKFLNFSDDPIRWYGVEVYYGYSIGDKTFVFNRVAIRDSVTRSPKTALKIMNKYRRYHDAIVFYNPANPQDAVLEPDNIGDIYTPLMVGGLLVLVWVIIFSDRSLEINTRGRDKYLHAGNIYQQQGKLDEALHEYNKIIENSPYLAVGYVNRGSVYLQQGKWELAVLDFNQAIKIDPMAGIVYFNRGNAYLGNKQYDKAWADMQKALEMGFQVKPEILERIKKHI